VVLPALGSPVSHTVAPGSSVRTNVSSLIR
jgi:hypothetical protein